MDNHAAQATMQDSLGFTLPTPASGLIEAKRRLCTTFRSGELVWLLDQHYDSTTPAWNIDILRQGAAGRWMCQRYRFDEQANVLYFLGERALSDNEFREARRRGTPLPEAPA